MQNECMNKLKNISRNNKKKECKPKKKENGSTEEWKGGVKIMDGKRSSCVCVCARARDEDARDKHYAISYKPHSFKRTHP